VQRYRNAVPAAVLPLSLRNGAEGLCGACAASTTRSSWSSISA